MAAARATRSQCAVLERSHATHLDRASRSTPGRNAFRDRHRRSPRDGGTGPTPDGDRDVPADRGVTLHDELAAVEPPLPIAEIIQGAVEIAAKHTGPDGALRLAVQVWAEAMHDEELARFVGGVYSGVRARLVTLAARAIQAGELPAGTDPEDVASVIFALLPGFALQRILIGGPEPASFQAGLHALFNRAKIKS
jgi:hypothetical protein